MADLAQNSGIWRMGALLVQGRILFPWREHAEMCSWGLKLPVSPTDNAVGQLDVGAGLINTPETFHIISEFKSTLSK